MDNPKISIVVPVYNVEKYLPRCIDSILAQTFTDFELLLIDDGSTDNSGRICDEYTKNDNRIRVFHTKNFGVSSARNKGIENAIGKYISFVDSDDEVFNTYLETLYKHIVKCDIVFFQNIWINEDQTRLMISLNNFYSDDHNSIEKEILFLIHNNTGCNLFGFTWNKIFRASIIKEHNIKFVKNLTLSEDEVFTLEFCKYINNIMVLNTPLYYYYSKAKGLTYKKKHGEEWIILALSLIDAISYYSNVELRKYLIKKAMRCLFVFIKRGYIFKINHYHKYIKILVNLKKRHINIPYKTIAKLLFT